MIDIEGLLKEIRPDSPCGEDLEYGAVADLTRIAQIKPEQQIGDTLVPAEEPDWGQVRRDALKLFSETKDLRVLVLLANASIRVDGWPGFRDCLALLDGMLDRYWAELHPQLDPDDANDPTMRINLIASLNDGATTLSYLREAPLVESVMGRFSLRDSLVASGELAHPADSEQPAPEIHAIEAAFKAAELEKLKEISGAVTESADLLAGIETRLMSLVGAGNAPDMSALSSLLSHAGKAVAAALKLRPDAAPVVAAGQHAEGDSDGSSQSAGAGSSGQPQQARGPIASREDVRRALDEICDYYRRYEPSSPLPILLERSKNLIDKDFLAIIQNLAPDGLKAVKNLRGPDEDAG